MIALSRVRSSWLMLDTNCDLLSLACWSCRFFSSISSKSRTFSIAASCGIRSIPHCPRNPSFRVKTAPELIAYAKANPGKITMGSPFSIRPAVAKLEELKQRNHQLEPLRGRAAQGARKNAAQFKREIEFDRRRPANSLNKSSTQLWLILDP